MTINDAIGRLGSLMQDTYSVQDKVRWLSEVDGKVKATIVDVHEDGGPGHCCQYDPDLDMDLELLVGPPFEEVYLRYLEAQIHYHNEEYDRYDAAIALFERLLEEYRNWYHRRHRSKSVKIRYF